MMWLAPDADAAWGADVKAAGEKNWRSAQTTLLRRVQVDGTPAHRVYSAALTNLKPGATFSYRVTKDGKEVFTSVGKARRGEGEAFTFAVYGDHAQDTDGQRKIATQIFATKPEMLVSTGDVVYGKGLVSEYFKKYFPVYNCGQLTPNQCAPITRQTLTVAIPGNHDIPGKVDLSSTPDALAYFYYWSLPMNGPLSSAQGPNLPEIKGSPQAWSQFEQTAPNYPRMSMYSFDYGDAHWTMIDSNPYVDWTSEELRRWIREDLRAASRKTWRFVGLHHPPFNSSKAHFNDQWMRLLSDIFEQEKVDIVFSGHVHNYQRTLPMTFQLAAGQAKFPYTRGGFRGDWKLDREFDGATKTKPNGVIWIVTGAGGAGLYNKEQEGDRSSWQEFTARFHAAVHSFTLVEQSPKRLVLRQVSEDGKELDRFTITR